MSDRPTFLRVPPLPVYTRPGHQRVLRVLGGALLWIAAALCFVVFLAIVGSLFFVAVGRPVITLVRFI